MESTDYHQLITFLLTPFLTETQSLSISETAVDQITVKIATTDMGRVIGKHGQTIHNLRILLRTFAKNLHLPLKHLSVEPI